ncbi:MAG TPA: hypothetical protein VNF07_04115 [Acidimicrobiales bacterium]|nr:hypothetical protein [Acidimicrobiales bacterium]
MIDLDGGPRPQLYDDGVVAAVESRQAVLDRRRREARLLDRRRRRRRIRRNRAIAGGLALALAFGLWGLVGAGGAAPQTDAPATHPTAVLTAALRTVHAVPGTLAAFPWSAKGEGAVAVLGEGVMARSAKSPVVPIASLTKMMTAYLVLRDHPLTAGAEGPTFTMGRADVQAWVHADQTNESNVAVTLGEQLTEHQLLEALLIPSADNVADFLASWDAGSVASFVVKMNTTAKALGMHHTHYADASGVNPASRSDATDQALLAAALMQSPVVRGIVAKPSLPFPVAGTIWNYNPGLGVDGIIGVKSGFTSQAQGCLATAAYRTAAGRHVLVVAVSLGQAGGLGQAARVDETLLAAAGRSLVGYRLPLPTSSVGTVALGGSSTSLYAAGGSPLIVGWPGMKLHEQVVSRTPVPAISSGAVFADLVVSSPGGVLASVPLTAATAPSTAGGTTATVLGGTTPTTLPSTAISSSLAAAG